MPIKTRRKRTDGRRALAGGSHPTSRGRNTPDGLFRLARREAIKYAIAALQTLEPKVGALARERPFPAVCALHSRIYWLS